MSYELWAWLVLEPDGTEGIITAYGPMGFFNLQHRKLAIAKQMQEIALDHAEREGKPIRLAHLKEV